MLKECIQCSRASTLSSWSCMAISFDKTRNKFAQNELNSDVVRFTTHESNLSCNKSERVYWFCDLFISKRQFIYSSWKGCKGSDVRGVPFVDKRYTKGVHFLSKMIYKRVRGWGWTSGRSRPEENLLSTRWVCEHRIRSGYRGSAIFHSRTKQPLFCHVQECSTRQWM